MDRVHTERCLVDIKWLFQEEDIPTVLGLAECETDHREGLKKNGQVINEQYPVSVGPLADSPFLVDSILIASFLIA